jgi:hypothetical protein
VAVQTYVVKNFGTLLDVVGASNPDPSLSGPKVVEARLWDGRIVSARYYKSGPKWNAPDAQTSYDVFYELHQIRPLVEHLLEAGESFVTVTGTSDLVCALEWSISDG